MQFICAKVTQAIAKGNRLAAATAKWKHFEIFGVDAMVKKLVQIHTVADFCLLLSALGPYAHPGR
jgi:hypothetical protein